ncbi:MAG: DUF992 domain-containing protein [Pseudomonadota bacterium]
MRFRLPLAATAVLTCFLFTPAAVNAASTVSAPTATGAAPEASRADDRLKRIGSLECVATPNGENKASTLSCSFRPFGETDVIAYDGALKNGGVALTGERSVVLMSVLAPTVDVRKGGLAGTYRESGRTDFDIAARGNVLVGGAADSIALEALAPRRDVFLEGAELTLDAPKAKP